MFTSQMTSVPSTAGVSAEESELLARGRAQLGAWVPPSGVHIRSHLLAAPVGRRPGFVRSPAALTALSERDWPVISLVAMESQLCFSQHSSSFQNLPLCCCNISLLTAPSRAMELPGSGIGWFEELGFFCFCFCCVLFRDGSTCVVGE